MNEDELPLATQSEAVYSFYTNKKLEGQCIRRKDTNGSYWEMYFPTDVKLNSSTRIEDGEKLYAKWETKRYELRFCKDETHAKYEAKECLWGDKFSFPDYAPSGYELVGWFNADFTVQYTDGRTPRAGFDTVNESYLPNGEIVSYLYFRPKYVQSASDAETKAD